jgi:hypothetical protein
VVFFFIVLSSLVSIKTEGESQGFALSQGSAWSQGSAVCTRSETCSDLEMAFPVLPKNRKDFDSLVPYSTPKESKHMTSFFHFHFSNVCKRPITSPGLYNMGWYFQTEKEFATKKA